MDEVDSARSIESRKRKERFSALHPWWSEVHESTGKGCSCNLIAFSPSLEVKDEVDSVGNIVSRKFKEQYFCDTEV